MNLVQRLLAVAAVALMLASCGGHPTSPQSPQPVVGHPRLLVREADLPRLRAWASDSNPVYRDGLAVLAGKAKTAMDERHVPAEDQGSNAYEGYPTEWYAELFAFMSLIEPDQAARDDYGHRARDLLMYVIDKASAGPGKGDEPFRDPRFATFDRSRWNGEAFGLTVDWAYPYFSSDDKARVHKVFLRWADEQFAAYPSQQGGGGAADFTKDGPFNDAAMLDDPTHVRWAMNNYYMAHMRNIGLMALAMDPADDPGDQLHNYVRNATGQWLYLTDRAMRTVAAGGLSPEGTEYAPTALAFLAQFLLALHTAGQDDTGRWGPQVRLADNPFWSNFLPAMLHTLPPHASPPPADQPDLGEVYQPAAYGDLQTYAAPDLMDTLGPLAIYAADRNDQPTVDTIRWYEANVPPGGPKGLTDRVGSTDQFLTAILYFLTFDPKAAASADPRSSLPLDHVAPGLHRYISRTCWCDDARMFTYALSWKTIDHQGGDGNEFEFYRRGEWLTKQRTGYDTTWFSDYHNTLTIENAPPANGEEDRYAELARRGSQVAYDPAGDPTVVAQSGGDGFFYATGDATNLYNSPTVERTDVTHASRSLVWLKPDYVVVYDRAETRTDGRFKRFWLQLPAPAEITGNRAVVHTPGGQQLVSTTLLPERATIVSTPAEADVGRPAVGDPMLHRLMVEAPGAPRSARFLHVVQGADGGASASAAALLRSSAGNAYEGAVVAGTAVMFPVDLGAAVASTTLVVPAGVTRVFVTGLTPNKGYRVETRPGGGGTELTVATEGDKTSDGGGVLNLTI
jgi:hypothetical protein